MSDGTNHERLHAVVVGCGRVGAGLALRLHELDYAVTVVDVDGGAFRRVRDLPVDTLEGVGFDRSTMLAAGIERAAAVAAVTSGDNTNIIVARTARESFGVPNVFARIADPRRAAIYERLGIPTVASVSLTIEMAMRWVLPEASAVRWIDPSSRVCLVERSVPAAFVGSTVAAAESSLAVQVVAITRLGSGMTVNPTLVLQEGDTLFAVLATDRVDEFDAKIVGGAAVTGGHA